MHFNFTGVIIDIFGNGSISVSGGREENGSLVYNFSNIIVTEFANKSMEVVGTEDGNWDGMFDEWHTVHGREYTPLQWRVWSTYIGGPALERGSKALMAIAGLLTVIGIVAVLAKLYVRRVVLKHFFVDDWLILLALLAGLCTDISFMISNYVNNMSLAWYAKRQPFAYSAKFQIWGDTLHMMTSNVHWLIIPIQATLARLSILWTFRRLSASREVRNVRIAIDAAAIFMILATIPIDYITVYPCWPPGYLFAGFDASLPDNFRCKYLVNGQDITYIMYLVGSCASAVFDLFVFALPFLVFRMSCIPRWKRRELYALFGFGLITFLISLGRAIQAILVLRDSNLDNDNLGYERSSVFAIGEATGVMVGACLPVLWKPTHGAWQRWREAHRTQSQYSSGAHQEHDNEATGSTVVLADVPNSGQTNKHGDAAGADTKSQHEERNET